MARMRILAAILAFVLVSDFDFDLPEELIAQEPLSDRASSRMLVVHRESGALEDKHFRDFPEFVDQGDCLVVNDSRVFPSRLFGTRGNGTARVEVFLVRPLNGEPLVWQALVRPGRKVPVGERIIFSHDLSAEIIDRSEHGERTIRFSPVSDLLARLEEIGHTPLPPYIRRTDTPEDRVRYQTVFAHSPGSVAAPTAGLHFTPLILDQCRAKGVTLAKITLHVGLGTFAPVNVTQVEDVRLHRERYSIEPETLSQIRNASRRICVGTTSVRTVETVYRTGVTAGETDIFISPGFEFLATGAMLTNFHLPASSLLMLVSALAGRDLIKKAYRHAVQQKYRFYSYGDCMLIL